MKKCFTTTKNFILWLLLFILVFRSDFIFGQNHKPSINNLSPMSRILLESLEAKEDKKINNYINFVPKNEKITGLFLINDGIEEEVLKNKGITIGTKAGNVWTYSVPVSQFANFVTTPNIKYIDIDRPVHLAMDSLKKAIHLDSISLNPNIPKPLCGENVILGFIDTGFDYTHPMYFDTEGDKNRIMWVWELDKQGVPPDGYNYGSFITDYDELLEKGWDYPPRPYDPPISYDHGTFVSGIATGSGAPYSQSTKYRGIAPCANIVFVSSSYSDDPLTFFSSSYSQYVDAVNLIFQTAESQNMPAVVNCSWGSILGPHDGSSLYSQALDALSGPGRIVVHAAGNSSSNNLHKSKSFTDQDTVMACIIRTQKNQGLDPGDLVNFVDFWGEKSMDFSIKISMLKLNKIVNSTTDIGLDDKIHNIFLTDNQDTVTLKIVTTKTDINDRPRIYMLVSGNYLGNLLIEVKSKKGQLHAWIQYDNFYSNPIYKATAGDKESNIDDEATTESVISAGSFNTKVQFKNINDVLIRHPEIVNLGELSKFSSFGPDSKGNVLPTIAAPGAIIVGPGSSFNPSFINSDSESFFRLSDKIQDSKNGRYYPYYASIGTSFATPTVTGTIALLLQLEPKLTPAQIKEILKKSAIHDKYTGSIPPEGKNGWGYGKLNAYQAIIELIKLTGTNDSTIKSSENDLILYPNPTDEYAFLLIDNIQASVLPTIKVFNASGQLMPTDHLNTESKNLYKIDIKNWKSGIYFVHVNLHNSNKVVKLIKK